MATNTTFSTQTTTTTTITDTTATDTIATDTTRTTFSIHTTVTKSINTDATDSTTTSTPSSTVTKTPEYYVSRFYLNSGCTNTSTPAAISFDLVGYDPCKPQDCHLDSRTGEYLQVNCGATAGDIPLMTSWFFVDSFRHPYISFEHFSDGFCSTSSGFAAEAINVCQPLGANRSYLYDEDQKFDVFNDTDCSFPTAGKYGLSVGVCEYYTDLNGGSYIVTSLHSSALGIGDLDGKSLMSAKANDRRDLVLSTVQILRSFPCAAGRGLFLSRFRLPKNSSDEA
ncbi:hypothetical protein HK100_011562 [Physocladia obscura]|uniref:Uncharacterized protein n=1 Tax=Physocladia obscura TaxID=109957 RepID=A0AAD5T9D3_9FUNG|nr:hypothetical protein HK100_011562 [Physocladia obscura]